MKIYKTTDYTGCYSIHYAKNEDEAIQKHLIHYSLLGLDTKIKIEELYNVDEYVLELCHDIYCNNLWKE